MKNIYLILFVITINAQLSAGNYKGFTVAVYARAYEVKEMENLHKLDSIWTEITQQVKVDKIYLETFRDKVMPTDKTLEEAKKYFMSKGVATAGGITFTINEGNRFETFCYSNPEHRKMAREITEFTAKHFDEFILDDFFFTSCKCELCIKAKGNKTWTEYRLSLMRQAAEELIIAPAKAINPDVKVVIKYPNWYEHFQALGFDLERGPAIFDGIYTGTETRDPVLTQQHLQQYESYLIFRYFENLKPGGNGGGWVDPGGMYYMDRYAEQLWLTLFAKAPEITLFDYRQLQRPIKETDKAVWQSGGTSLDFDAMMKPFTTDNGSTIKPKTISRAAGYAFEAVEKFINKLGRPTGIKSYKPFHSEGEDFIQNYFGMIGIPMDIVPEFPVNSNMLLLTESAKYDSFIVTKIKNQLLSGKDVLITSGLLNALQGKGIEDIVELEYTERKALIKDYVIGRNNLYKSKEEILIPQIKYNTNDSWEDISCLDAGIGWPILHQAKYANNFLFILTLPDNFADLYNYPPEALNRIRQVLSKDLNVRIAGSSQVSLFVYDNNTIIVESFQPEDVTIKLIAEKGIIRIRDILSGQELNGVQHVNAPIWGRENKDGTEFEISIKPHSFRVFQLVE